MADLTEGELHVLRSLAEMSTPGADITVPDLQTQTGMTKPTLHRLVKSLAKRGLITTRQEPKEDRPKSSVGRPPLLVGLSDKGRDELVAYHRRLSTDVVELGAVIAAWTPPES